MDLMDHGIMRVNVFPQTFLCLAVQIDHFLDVHDIVLDQIDHVTLRCGFAVVIDGNHCVILIPTPVFFPGKAVAEQAAVRHIGKACVQILEVGVLIVNAADVAGRSRLGRKLSRLHRVGNLVGDDLPAESAVQWNRVRI